MLSLTDRINLLESDLKATPPAFIMARELPFAIFRYDPHLDEEGEWKMRGEIQKLATRVEIRLRAADQGQIVLGFGSNDDFERLLELLRK